MRFVVRRRQKEKHMKAKIVATALAALSIALLAGCSSSDTPDTIPNISTPAMRDALILRELERQTELLRQINDKLDCQPKN